MDAYQAFLKLATLETLPKEVVKPHLEAAKPEVADVVKKTRSN
jgi:hypothetical protein